MFEDRIAEIKKKKDSLVDYLRRVMTFAFGLACIVLAATVIGFTVRLFTLSLVFGFIAFVASIVVGTIWLLNYISKEYGSLISKENTDQS